MSTEALNLELCSEMASVLDERDLLCPALPELVAGELADAERRAALWQPWAWRTASVAPLAWCYFGFLHRASPTVTPTNMASAAGHRKQVLIDAAAIGDFWMFGHWGHGVNSYALGLVARCGSLLLTQHVAWGGVYGSDADTDRVNQSVRAWNATLAELVRSGLHRRSVPEIVLVELYRDSKHIDILPPPPPQPAAAMAAPADSVGSGQESQQWLAGLVDIAQRHLDLLPDRW
jgi:hypothetical protein